MPFTAFARHVALVAKSRLNGSCVVALRNQVLDAFGRNSAEGRSRADYWPTDRLVNSFHQKLSISHVGALLTVQYFNSRQKHHIAELLPSIIVLFSFCKFGIDQTAHLVELHTTDQRFHQLLFIWTCSGSL